MASVYRLLFNLPPAYAELAEPGRHTPCLHGCVLAVTDRGGVTIEGPTREQVFDQATRFLRAIRRRAAGARAQKFPAILVTPRRAFSDVSAGGRDSWQIVVGAEVAFTASAIEPTLFDAFDAGQILQAG